MLIELTEALACPVCLSREGRAPPQGLVAFVEEREGSRVRRGSLGCVSCEARFPIEGGVIDFAPPELRPDSGGRERRAPAGADAPGARVARGAPDHEAVALAALLGLEGASGGIVLLGEGLGPRAAPLVALAGEVRLLVLEVPGSAPSAPDPSTVAVTRARRVPGTVLPLLPGRLRGVALLGGTPPRLREAARALAPGGRLAVLRPDREARAVVEALSLRVLAAEKRALVAVSA